MLRNIGLEPVRPAGLKPAVSLDIAEYNSAGHTDLEVYVPVPTHTSAQNFNSFVDHASRPSRRCVRICAGLQIG
jgi:hypothetical protein